MKCWSLPELARFLDLKDFYPQWRTAVRQGGVFRFAIPFCEGSS